MSRSRRPPAPDPYLCALVKVGARLRYVFATHSGRLEVPALHPAAVWRTLNMAEVIGFFRRVDPDVRTIRVGDVIFRANDLGGWINSDKRRGVGLPWA